MEVSISSELQAIYKESRKNYDMALMTLLDSFDQNTFQRAFEMIKSISLKGKPISIKIGKTAVEQIKEAFECKEVSNDLVNTLLWIAVLFPEI